MSNSGTLGRKNRIKRFFTILGIALGVILALAIAYLLYVIAFYHRFPDNQVLEIVSAADAEAEIGDKVPTEVELTIVTYNVGFGAYSPDYTFFMDGGKSSWAKSKESATNLITGAGELSLSFEPDFVLLQEIDIDSTRTYHLDELALLRTKLSQYENSFAQNYDSPYLLYPFYEPHGASKAGLAVFSKYDITYAIRRSLPVSSDFNRLLDLDRCYSVNRIPTENGKELVLINIHMSAYGSNPSVREGQINMFTEEMRREYEAGNYVIVGGDFNHNLRDEIDPDAPGWAQRFPREDLPDGFSLAFDVCQGETDIAHNTGRASEVPYDPATTYTVTLDGFFVSDNITVTSYHAVDTGYLYSDHDPVVMQFVLEE